MSWRRCYRASCDDQRDVVSAPGIESLAGEVTDGSDRIVGGTQSVRDAVVVDHVAEPVAAQEQGLVGAERSIDIDVGLDGNWERRAAQALGDEMRPAMALAVVPPLRNVVRAELDKPACTEEVAAAVADVERVQRGGS